jgi:anti-anti-sigma factor
MGRLRVVQDGAAPVVFLMGEFDLSAASDVRELLLSLGPQIVLDLEETTFIDSTTLNTLLLARNEGIDIIIVNVPGFIRRVLELTGFDGLFNVAGPLDVG